MPARNGKQLTFKTDMGWEVFVNESFVATSGVTLIGCDDQDFEEDFEEELEEEFEAQWAVEEDIIVISEPPEPEEPLYPPLELEEAIDDYCVREPDSRLCQHPAIDVVRRKDRKLQPHRGKFHGVCEDIENPRWRDVIRSINFILAEADRAAPAQEISDRIASLRNTLEELRQMTLQDG